MKIEKRDSGYYVEPQTDVEQKKIEYMIEESQKVVESDYVEPHPQNRVMVRIHGDVDFF